MQIGSVFFLCVAEISACACVIMMEVKPGQLVLRYICFALQSVICPFFNCG